MSQLPPEVYQLIDAALVEDQTFNDPTTGLLIPPDIRGIGMIRAKAQGVLAGLEVSAAVCERWIPELVFERLLSDGTALTPGSDIARVEGSAGSILRAERIALNFLQRMSGIASDTNRYVQAIAGCPARIVDTRKRSRTPLFGQVCRPYGRGPQPPVESGRRNINQGQPYRSARLPGNGLERGSPTGLVPGIHTIKVEVEVESLAGVEAVLDAGAHIIMLDNMPVELMRQAMEIIGDRAVVEASGGINMETVRAVAETGVHLISIGGLTHSTQALDISLDLEFP